MKEKPIVFVAFREQDNLGVGHLASLLMQNGYKAKLIDYRAGQENILEQIEFYDPLVVGFSIIFQYHLYDFRDLIAYLRDNGIDCHFCAGGHYPSLRFEDLLSLIPQLDSVVLFEGENTLLELVQRLSTGKDWKEVSGIAFRENGTIRSTPLRPLEKDLDNFPPPVRLPLTEYGLGKKYATLLAGRGCYYDCSFCSIREFYSKPPGPLKRLRRPDMVVKEMELLYREMDASIFMFQDDDFPVAGSKGSKWVSTFCDLLDKSEMSRKILWKINCRPDEVDAGLFAMMKESGLFLVYLGIESGTDYGLRLMNKHMTAETSIRAVKTLKELDISFDFGYMLLDPLSTYRSLVDNLDFLEMICGDGSSPVTFCKMLPYAETRIAHQLRKEGRLRGKHGFEDYDFLDESLNHFYSFLMDCFGEWVTKHDGVLNVARWARYHLLVYKNLFPMTPHVAEISASLRDLIAKSNQYFVNTVRRMASKFNSIGEENDEDEEFHVIKEHTAAKHSLYQRELNDIICRLREMAA